MSALRNCIEARRALNLLAAPLDPSAMQYRAALVAERAVDKCAGCVFRGQRVKVCKEAGRLAKLAGMPDCEECDNESRRTFVYVLAPPADERQVDLVTEQIQRI